MNLTDALRGVRRLAFDTAPLIYFVEQHPQYFDRMLFIMRQVDAGLITGLASTIVLAEVLVQPIRVGNHTLAKRYEAILSDSHHFQLEPVATAPARYAADLRARYNLRIPDALHIATSIASGCDAFLTNDSSLKRVSEINILVLDALETDLS